MYRVLIVDEDIIVQKALKLIIEGRKDFCVDACFSDGQEAVQYCKSHTPDLVFLDLKLRECNGLQIIKEIRKLQPNVDTCILSVYQNLDFVRQALDLNVKHYILKPISSQAIYNVLNEFGESEENYILFVEQLQDIIESKDFKRVFEESHSIAEAILKAATKDKETTETMLKGIERELTNQYFDNPFKCKQEFDSKMPINREFLDDPIVVEMWISGILDYIFKYRFKKRYGSVVGTLEYIDGHIKEPIVMAEIVENCHICQQYLLRIFKEQMQMSARDYIQYRKIMLAKWYLYIGDYSTLDIAMKLGYGDSGYFAKVFKKLEHVTPYQYRLHFSTQSPKMAME